MNNILIVNDCGPSIFDIEPVKEHPSLQISFSEGVVCSPQEIDTNISSDTVVLSRDHAMSYYGLKKLKKIGLIVVDQHMDIYAEEYLGKELNRANVFRLLHEQGVIAHVVFVGVRASEEALLQQPKIALSTFDEYSAHKDNGILDSLEGNITIITSYENQSIQEGVVNGLEILKEKEVTEVALDIDLDAFSTDEVEGVEFNHDLGPTLFFDYMKQHTAIIKEDFSHNWEAINDIVSKEFPKNTNERKQFQEKLLELFWKIKETEHPFVVLLEDVLWYLSQSNQQGLDTDVDGFGKSIKEQLEKNNQSIVYKGITEFEPALDKDGKTRELVHQLIHELQEF